MPALGRTVSVDSVRADHRAMDESEFRRAFLNQWTVAKMQSVINLDAWRALTDPATTVGEPVCFAFDTTPERSRSAIAAAGYGPDGNVHVELAEHRAGTGWVIDRLEELIKRHNPSAVYVDARGPARSLLDEALRRNLDVTAVTPQEHAEACGQLYARGRAGHAPTPRRRGPGGSPRRCREVLAR